MQPRNRPNSRRLLLLGLSLASLAPTAWAQGVWPQKPVRLVFPFGPGSGPDTLARVLAEQLKESHQQAFIVDNKPGANGAIAASSVLQLPADGYTLLFSAASGTVINQAVRSKLPFDTVRDFEPVVQIAAGGVYVVCHPEFGARDLRGLVEIAKSQPGAVDYATWGVGSSGHLIMSSLQERMGVTLNHIAYKDVSQILLDLQAGRIKVAVVDPISPVPFIKAGKLRGLAVSGSHRGVALPDVPTMTEQGFAFDTDGWFAIFAPKGTPQVVVDALNRSVNAAMTNKEVKARMEMLNLSELPIKSPGQFSRTVRDDLETWKTIASKANISLD